MVICDHLEVISTCLGRSEVLYSRSKLCTVGVTGAKPLEAEVASEEAAVVAMVFTAGLEFPWDMCKLFRAARLP